MLAACARRVLAPHRLTGWLKSEQVRTLSDFVVCHQAAHEDEHVAAVASTSAPSGGDSDDNPPLRRGAEHASGRGPSPSAPPAASTGECC